VADQAAPGRKLPSFPLFRGIRGIKPSDIPREALAGLTIACVAVPLGLGYGAMAGLPPEVGLYGTILPLAAYAMLGSSRRIVMAPDSALALIIAGSVIPLAAGNAERELGLAVLTSLVAGAVLLVAGVLRIGRLAEFVSRPVLIGYLSGVGITVVTSQLDDVFGYSIEGESAIQKTIFFLQNLPATHVTSLILGTLSVVGMVVLTRIGPNLPNALVVVAVGTIGVAALGLGSQGVELVGTIPAGLPSLTIPPLDLKDMASVFMPAVAIATLSFVDSSLTARSFAARHGEDLDTDTEALGIGAADIAASISSGLPASGSGLRTSLAEAAGAHSQLAPLISAGLLLIVLLFFTGVLALMPWPVLGGVLIFAGLTIVDVVGIRTIRRFDRAEFWIATLCLLGCVFLGTFAGVFIAIFLSIFDVVRRLSAPRDSVTRPAGNKDVVVYRFEAPLFFPNAEAIRTRVLKLASAGEQPRVVVLDGSAITQVDTTATYALARLRDDLDKRGVRLVLAGFPDYVRQGLEAAPSAEPEITAFTLFPTVDEAVVASNKVD
jgi:high affinity sulfate transporter 1